MTDASHFQLGFNKVNDTLVCVMHHSSFVAESADLENYVGLMAEYGGIGVAQLDEDQDLAKVRSSFMPLFHGDAKETLGLLNAHTYVIIDYNFIEFMVDKGVSPDMLRSAVEIAGDTYELPLIEAIRASIRGFLKLGYTKAQIWTYYKYFQRWRAGVEEYMVTEMTDYQKRLTDWVDGIMMRLPFMMSMPHRVHKTLIKQEAALMRIADNV